ncbi:MAG: hypothetical protein WC755_02935 [Candidatus Woesearchaeota archaeon]|jgi:hypothetical protein
MAKFDLKQLLRRARDLGRMGSRNVIPFDVNFSNNISDHEFLTNCARFCNPEELRNTKENVISNINKIVSSFINDFELRETIFLVSECDVLDFVASNEVNVHFVISDDKPCFIPRKISSNIVSWDYTFVIPKDYIYFLASSNPDKKVINQFQEEFKKEIYLRFTLMLNSIINWNKLSELLSDEKDIKSTLLSLKETMEKQRAEFTEQNIVKHAEEEIQTLIMYTSGEQEYVGRILQAEESSFEKLIEYVELLVKELEYRSKSSNGVLVLRTLLNKIKVRKTQLLDSIKEGAKKQREEFTRRLDFHMIKLNDSSSFYEQKNIYQDPSLRLYSIIDSEDMKITEVSSQIEKLQNERDKYSQLNLTAQSADVRNKTDKMIHNIDSRLSSLQEQLEAHKFNRNEARNIIYKKTSDVQNVLNDKQRRTYIK